MGNKERMIIKKGINTNGRTMLALAKGTHSEIVNWGYIGNGLDAT